MAQKHVIEYVKPWDLKLYERNARTHNDAQIAQIVASIKEFGFTNPVLIDDDNVLIAGHGRTAAALDMGLETIPAIRLSGLRPEQIKALRLADNKLALNAGWDEELLSMELGELQDLDFNLDAVGFSFDEIEGLLGDDWADAPTAPEQTQAPEKEEVEHEPTKPTDFKYQERYAVLVECTDESHQSEVYERLKGQGYKCKVLVN